MSAAIMDFDAFLDNVDDYHEEVYALYCAVKDETDMGLFNCVAGNRADTWIVKSSAGIEDLFLASQAAKQAFLQEIMDRFVRDEDDGMDMEGWYHYRRAMERN